MLLLGFPFFLEYARVCGGGVDKTPCVTHHPPPPNPPPATLFRVCFAEHEGQEAFLNWTYAVSNTTDPPLIFSVSYGDDEPSVSGQSGWLKFLV